MCAVLSKKSPGFPKQCVLKQSYNKKGYETIPLTVHPTKLLPLLLEEQLIKTKDSVSCKECHKYNFAKVKDMLNAYHANT